MLDRSGIMTKGSSPEDVAKLVCRHCLEHQVAAVEGILDPDVALQQMHDLGAKALSSFPRDRDKIRYLQQAVVEAERVWLGRYLVAEAGRIEALVRWMDAEIGKAERNIDVLESVATGQRPTTEIGRLKTILAGFHEQRETTVASLEAFMTNEIWTSQHVERPRKVLAFLERCRRR